MATYKWGVDETYLSDADLSASQYCLVKTASTTGYIDINATAGGSVIGVLQNDPKSRGEAATVRIFGYTKVRANDSASSITYGGLLKSGSDGMVEGFVQTTPGSTFSVGRAEEALSSTGSPILIEMFLWPSTRQQDVG